MNVVFLSPHFPLNYYNFCIRLRELGANVLGIADEPYEWLRPELRDALTEYYYINDMHDYEQLVRACGYFTYRYGHIDHLDSLNEYWLETEARLRTDFNILGLKTAEIADVTLKSRMKEIFRATGTPVARGKVIKTRDDGRKFTAEVGYPVIVKPDRGVGASDTYKLHNDADLEDFFDQKRPIDYIMEEFIEGQIWTFDGLTNRAGEIVFYTSHVLSQGVMESVNEDRDVYYYSLREIPPKLEQAGFSAVKAFDVRERFFHIEFFHTANDEFVGLEINVRPPGGFTMDMFNFANDIDMYHEWANVITRNNFSATYTRPYHCCYVGRKYSKHYRHSHDEIMDAYGYLVVHHEELKSVFSAAMGNYGYLIRSPELEEITAAAHFIQEKV